MNSLCSELCTLLPQEEFNREILSACQLVAELKTPENILVSDQMNQLLQCRNKPCRNATLCVPKQ